MTSDKKAALKEAVTDTALALVINFPLNILLLEIAGWIGINDNDSSDNIILSIFLTAVFTTVAIIRKYYVRLYFNKKHLKKEAKRT
jgi:hypothetical protein